MNLRVEDTILKKGIRAAPGSLWTKLREHRDGYCVAEHEGAGKVVSACTPAPACPVENGRPGTGRNDPSVMIIHPSTAALVKSEV